jgi:hypothetical protein
MYSNTILKLDLIIIIIQKYCFKYLKPDKDIDKIKKSKTIQFVLDQLNDIRKTKDFKVLKSIFTIEKKYKIKDLKDWLGILCANKPGLFSKHFKLDVEIDMTKGYKSYVNLLSKLGNNKTKVDLKKSNKNISILFNLLFFNIIVGGVKTPQRNHPYALDLPSRSERLRNAVKDIMAKKEIVNILQAASENFAKSITDASKSEPKTLLTIVGIMEAALQATESAQLSDNITCIPQEANLGTCWIIAAIAALVYSSNFGMILEYICRKEISKLIPSELKGNVTIKTIILTNFRILFILQKYDQIRTHIGKKAYTMPNNFIRQFVTQIFDISMKKDPTSSFFKAAENPTSVEQLLTMGGDYSDRQHLITNILEQGFGFNFTTDATNPNIRFYNYVLETGEDGTAERVFRLLHIPYAQYKDAQYKEFNAYTLASYIVVARNGEVRHSVAVVEKNGKNVQCNGWCDPDTGCMVQEIRGRTFSLGRFDFDIDDEFTLALAFDASQFVYIPTTEENFATQLASSSSLSSSVNSSLSSSLSSLFDY